MPANDTEPIATFDADAAHGGGKIEVAFSDRLHLHIRLDGRIAAFKVSVEHAQEIVNELAGKPVWTAI